MSACVACAAALATPVACEACGALQPLRGVADCDPFRILGLPRAYALRRPDLEKAYLRASRLVHPDRRPDDAAAARRLSTLVNDAYATLRDPLRRAARLVALEGGPAPASLKPDPGFVAEQFALRERADGGDRQGVRDEVEHRAADARAAIDAEFAALPAGPGRIEALGRIAAHLQRLTFFGSLLRDLEGECMQRAV